MDPQQQQQQQQLAYRWTPTPVDGGGDEDVTATALAHVASAGVEHGNAASEAAANSQGMVTCFVRPDADSTIANGSTISFTITPQHLQRFPTAECVAINFAYLAQLSTNDDEADVTLDPLPYIAHTYIPFAHRINSASYLLGTIRQPGRLSVTLPDVVACHSAHHPSDTASAHIHFAQLHLLSMVPSSVNAEEDEEEEEEDQEEQQSAFFNDVIAHVLANTPDGPVAPVAAEAAE